jgi:hypothetical protein
MVLNELRREILKIAYEFKLDSHNNARGTTGHFTSFNLTEKLKPHPDDAVIRELEFLADEGLMEIKSPIGDISEGLPFYYCKITSGGIKLIESW